jgi:hypothetical protein
MFHLMRAMLLIFRLFLLLLDRLVYMLLISNTLIEFAFFSNKLPTRQFSRTQFLIVAEVTIALTNARQRMEGALPLEQ